MVTQRETVIKICNLLGNPRQNPKGQRNQKSGYGAYSF